MVGQDSSAGSWIQNVWPKNLVWWAMLSLVRPHGLVVDQPAKAVLKKLRGIIRMVDLEFGC